MKKNIPFIIFLIICSHNCFGQFILEKNYLWINEIYGSNDKVIFKTSPENLYDFNTKSLLPEANEFYVSGLPRVGTRNTENLKYIAKQSTDGKIALQFEQNKETDEVVIINTVLKNSKIVKLSKKVTFNYYGNKLSEDGSYFQSENNIINLKTGKVITYNPTELGYFRYLNVEKNIAVFSDYDKQATVKDLTSNKIIKKIVFQPKYVLDKVNQWLIYKINTDDINVTLEAQHLFDGRKVKFPNKDLHIRNIQNLTSGKYFLETKNKINTNTEFYVWDVETNKLSLVSIKVKEEGQLSYMVCLGNNNTIYYYSNINDQCIQKIDYLNNKIVQEWIWGDEYTKINTRMRLSRFNYTKDVEEIRLKPFFSKYENFTENSVVIANAIQPLKETRQSLFRLPFSTKYNISQFPLKYYDINKDGYKDILYQDDRRGHVTILLNDKQNNFSKAIQLPKFVNENSTNDSKIYFKDVNGDGSDELIVSEEDALEEIFNLYIISLSFGDNMLKYYPIKKQELTNFKNYFKLKQNFIEPDSNTKKADLNKDGKPDYAVITYRFNIVSIRTLPPLAENELRKMNLKSFSGTLYKDNFSIVFPSTPNFTIESDFDNDGNDDFLVSTDYHGTYIFFNKNNGTEFEVKNMNIQLRGAEKFNINNTSVFIGRNKRNLIAFSIDEKRNVHSEVLFKNIVESNFDYDAFEDLDNDGLKEFIDFASVFDRKEQIVNQIDITVYKPLLTKNNIYYNGLVIDVEKEQAEQDAAWLKKYNEAQEEKKRREETASSSSTKKITESKTEVIDYSKLKQGLAIYKGYSSSGLVIEVQAKVWYGTIKSGGMLGIKYNEVYKAECLKFRYPTNTSKWNSLSGSDCLYRCYKDSYTLCIAISSMVFTLGSPVIYEN